MDVESLSQFEDGEEPGAICGYLAQACQMACFGLSIRLIV